MLKGFKEFVLRGNVLDLAIAVVIGGAFSAVVGAMVKDLLTPLIGAIAGKPGPHGERVAVSHRRFPERGHFVPADRRRRVLLRRGADECADRAPPPRGGAERSDYEKVSGMPQRGADRGAEVRVLYVDAELRGGKGVAAT